MTRLSSVALVILSACATAETPPTVVELLPRDTADELQITLAPKIDAESVLTTRLGEVDRREVFASTARGSGATRTVVFDRVGTSGPVRPLLEVVLEDGLFVDGSVELIAAPERTFLVIRVDVPGTGSYNADVVLHWSAGRWQQIDANKWLSDVKLPPCFEIWKGRRADLRALRGDSRVWVADDANCCPTGGDVSAELELRERALRVRTQASRLASLDAIRKDPARAEALKKCAPGM